MSETITLAQCVREGARRFRKAQRKGSQVELFEGDLSSFLYHHRGQKYEILSRDNMPERGREIWEPCWKDEKHIYFRKLLRTKHCHYILGVLGAEALIEFTKESPFTSYGIPVRRVKD